MKLNEVTAMPQITDLQCYHHNYSYYNLFFFPEGILPDVCAVHERTRPGGFLR